MVHFRSCGQICDVVIPTDLETHAVVDRFVCGFCFPCNSRLANKLFSFPLSIELVSYIFGKKAAHKRRPWRLVEATWEDGM